MAGEDRPPRLDLGRRPAGRRPPRPFLRRRILAGTGALAIIVVIWFLWSLFQPFAGAGGQRRVEVTIPPGSGVSAVGSILERDGVISSGFFFKLRVALAGDRGRLRAGTYELHPGMSYGAALHALVTQSGFPPDTNVTIVPGRSRVQVQAALRRSGIRGDYLSATVSSPLLDPTAYGAPSGTPSLEGFLWPDTYNLRRPVKVQALVADQLKEFQRQFAQVDLSYARSKNLTAYDVLKIASLVSGEALKPADAARVASVIYNRLRDGIKLGMDSTVSYATGHYGVLTEKDLNSPSPWNTRNHVGLPPTPIDSPDMAAIQAAAHPADTDYLYFVNRVCGGGALRFTASYQRFLGWSRDWNDALARAHDDIAAAEFCKR